MPDEILDRHLLRNALAKLNDVVLITEAEPVNVPGPRILYVNEAFERMTGFSAAEVMGLTPRLLQGPRSDRAELQRLRLALDAWESCRICVTNYRKNGIPFDVEFEVVPVADDAGWFTHWVAVQREVTERTLAAAAVDGASTVDTLVQDAGVELAEYTGAAGCTVCLRGTADDRWGVQHVRYQNGRAVDDDITPPAALLKALDTIVNAPKAVADQEWLSFDLDGTAVRGTRHASAAGCEIVMLVWRTVSGPWELAEVLVPIVSKRVLAKYDTLLIQRDRARLQHELEQARKLEAVGRLAGGIAHDFNNLLTVITGNLEFLREQLGEQLSDEPTELAEVLHATERARALVAQLMSISHRRRSANEAVDLGELVTSTAALLRRTLGPSIEIVTEIAPGKLLIDADFMLLGQALLNLVLNARDAIESVVDPSQAAAHGTITIAARTVSMSSADARHWQPLREGGCLELTVSDTGPGMSDQVRESAFEPFFTTKDVGAGTGLGLASVRGTVTNLGGVIQLEPVVPHGVLARMRFPRGTIAAAHDIEVGALPDRSEQRTLLVVDDEAGVRRIIARVLQSAGHHVLEAEDGTDAIAKFAAHGGAVSGVLTDVRMPKLSGIEMARELRRSRPDLPVLFLSGNAEPDFLTEFAPSAALLNKPFSATNLLTALDALFATSTRDQR